MKNIEYLKKELEVCKQMAVESNIKIGKIADIKINTRAKKRWGQCKRTPNGAYIISISNRLLADNVADDGAINTIIHELLHSVKGCMNHGENWKREAKKVNRAYGINIKRGASAEEKGVEEIEETPKAIKYQFECKECGKVYSRVKASNFTKNWQNYRCGCCGGEFTKIM